MTSDTSRLHYLLQAYAFGRLTEEEMDELSTAALDDDEVFEAMAEADTHRRYVSDTGVRNRLLKVIEVVGEDKRRGWRNLSLLWHPLSLAVVASVIAVAIFVQPQPDSKQLPSGVKSDPSSQTAQRLFELPLQPNPGVRIRPPQWQGTAVREGTILSLTLDLERSLAVFVAQKMPDGRTRWISPASLSDSADHIAGLVEIRFDAYPPWSSLGANKEVAIRIATTESGADFRLSNTSIPSGLYEVRYAIEDQK